MNNLEKWICDHIGQLSNSGTYQGGNYLIKNVVPPIYDSYALIYHPYLVPPGPLQTYRQKAKDDHRKRIALIKGSIRKDFNISMSDYMLMPDDIEGYIIENYDKESISEEQLKERLEQLSKQLFIQSFTGFDEGMDDGSLREVSWRELYAFHKLDFTKDVTCTTISNRIHHKNRVLDGEMPEQDNMPKSVLVEIKDYLAKSDIHKVDINSMSNTVGVQQIINEPSEDVSIEDLISDSPIHIVASLDKDWIFITPNDFCRTIVAGSGAFIERLRANSSLEMSEALRADHKLN